MHGQHLMSLRTWSEKHSQSPPSTVFAPVLSDIVEWAELPAATSADTVWMYLLHRYGDISVRDYTVVDLGTLTALWHSANYYKFAGLAATTKQIYNPIENYNRTETETVERTPDLSTETTTTDTPRVTETVTAVRTPDLTEAESIEHTPHTTETETHNLAAAESGTTGTTTSSQNSQSSETIGQVAPFDSSLFDNSAKSTGSASGSESGSETIAHGKTVSDTGTLTRATTGTDQSEIERSTTGTDTTQTTKTATGSNTKAETRAETGTDTTERESHIAGNIGVTTTQQMLEQERNIVNFVMLDRYLSEWVNAFCVGVWWSE